MMQGEESIFIPYFLVFYLILQSHLFRELVMEEQEKSQTLRW